MVQGLGFLSKKSWHTKNLANQEKVWMAEQQKEAEQQKTKELAKQIQQEREQEELDKIAGKKSSTLDRGIDWMYQHGSHTEVAKEDAAKKQEEFLLGKDFVAGDTATGDFDNGDQTAGIHNVMAHQEQPAQQEQQVSHYEPSVKDRNESFRMRIEDPMFAVSRQQYDKEQKHDQIKALYERVVGNAAADSDDSAGDSGRGKKERKRNKKKRSSRDKDHHRKRKKSRHSRNRSPSYERHRSGTNSSRRDRRSPSLSVSDNSRHSYQDSHRHSRRQEDRSHRRFSREEDDHDRHSSGRREVIDDDKRYGHSSRERTRFQGEESGRNHDARQNDSRKKEGYGLKRATATSSSSTTITRNTKELGPNQELLEKKRQERETERRRIRDTASSRRRTTGEERARALREMQDDARKRDERARRTSGMRRHNEEETPSRQGASFLTDMTKQTHGIAGNSSVSLSERLRQNIHTNQRSHESFL